MRSVGSRSVVSCLGARRIMGSLHLCSRTAPFSSMSGGRMLNPSPRPTQYNTEIVNEVVSPVPGRQISFTPFLVGLAAFMAIIPCVSTTMELNKYYREHEHLYKNGWSVLHYDNKKNTYLS